MGVALREFIKKLFRGFTVSGILRNKVLDLQILKLQLIPGDSGQDQQFSAHIISVEILPGIGLREPLLLCLFNQIAERNRAVEFIEKIARSEERRVGKEWKVRGAPAAEKERKERGR